MNKLLNLLTKPHLIPKKIIKKINHYLELKKYDQNIFETNQNEIFEKLGLNRELGIEKLKSIKKEHNLDFDRTMSSEHEVLFSSISKNKNINIQNILEIGTFDGYNALLLSKLFPNSMIDTIDLPNENEDFINFYERKNIAKKFIEQRDKILSIEHKINFIQMNSLNLINHVKKYDLIWIDGAHGYPVVCIDIINSLNLINDNGLIICDDIITNLDYLNSDKMYRSIAAYETIDQLKKVNLINFELIYKRLSAEHNSTKNSRKYIAIIKKNEKISF